LRRCFLTPVGRRLAGAWQSLSVTIPHDVSGEYYGRPYQVSTAAYS
jgi:hypothetical protein